METIDQIEYRGFYINVHPDDCDINPRTEWDEFGHMVCFHSRYDLGDKHEFKNPVYFLGNILQDWHDTEDVEEIVYGDENPMDTLLEMFEEHAIVLPLYLYDHSGLTMSTHPFSCPWDSGQVGWIYSTFDEIKAEYGELTDETKEKARRLLVSSVEVYDMYLTGQVYGYTIEPTERNKEIECDDSCWGFFGDYDEYMVPEAKSIIDYCIKEYREEVKKDKQRKREMDQFMSFAWAL